MREAEIQRATEIAIGDTGKSMLVDVEDYPILSRHPWRLTADGYVQMAERRGLMAHRLIFPVRQFRQVDHRNGNKLDNRKSNLRECWCWENCAANRRKKRGKTSKYTGVYYKKENNRWNATIYFQRRAHNLGWFATEVEAALAYDRASRRLRGEFAPPPNIPEGAPCES